MLALSLPHLKTDAGILMGDIVAVLHRSFSGSSVVTFRISTAQDRCRYVDGRYGSFWGFIFSRDTYLQSIRISMFNADTDILTGDMVAVAQQSFCGMMFE